MHLTPSELATVLAALRLWQQRITIPAANSSSPAEAISAAAPELFADSEPLDTEQVELLCQRLNCGG